MKPSILTQTTADLARHEGFREFAYPDPLSKLGKKYVGRKWQWGFVPGDVLLAQYGESEADGRPWTVGYGFTRNVKPSTRVSKQFATEDLASQIIDHSKILDEIMPEWQSKPLAVSTVLMNMTYNMGTRFKKFGQTLLLIKEGQYAAAAENLKKTPWYKQVGDRAVELCLRLKTGKIAKEHLVVKEEN